MLKVNKKMIVPVMISELRIGDTFLHNNTVYMRIKYNDRYHSLNLETGMVHTNIHNDVRVQKVDCELTVVG